MGTGEGGGHHLAEVVTARPLMWVDGLHPAVTSMALAGLHWVLGSGI